MLSRQAVASEIERLIFAPLQEYNPFTLQLEPILLDGPPEINTITQGAYEGGLRYEMTILEAATWDDGTPVTGHDYLFTMKAALNPYVANSTWSTYVSQIANIVVDSADPKNIEVIMKEPYILGEEVICQFSIYPEHIYDVQKIHRKYNFVQMLDWPSNEGTQTYDDLEKWATEFNSEQYSRDIVIGCGPYRFMRWQAGQQISLLKKDTFWANHLEDRHPFLYNRPSKITYFIIPDEQTAITSL